MVQFRPYLPSFNCGASKRIQWISHFELPETWPFSAEYVGWRGICWFVLSNASKFKLKTFSVHCQHADGPLNNLWIRPLIYTEIAPLCAMIYGFMILLMLVASSSTVD